MCQPCCRAIRENKAWHSMETRLRSSTALPSLDIPLSAATERRVSPYTRSPELPGPISLPNSPEPLEVFDYAIVST